jgi:preprotein translocase subunit SecB
VSEAAQPIFGIEKIYLKDLSVEVPNGPQIFLERETPAVEVGVRTDARPLSQEGMFEVVVTITVTAKIKDKTLFLAEAAQAGVFQIRNMPQQDLGTLLGVTCPNTLFPSAREAISAGTSRAGFPPLVLAPMSFESIYQQQQIQQSTKPN